MRTFTSIIVLLLGVMYTTNAQSAFELCSGCKMDNGAGYNKHPTRCDQFVHCYYDENGLHGIVKPCPFSTYWSSDKLTCVSAEQIMCPNEMCKDQEDGTIFNAESHCRGFWECQDGKAQPNCCPQGQNFNGTCVDNIDDGECTKTCFNEAKNTTCDKKALPGKPAFFQQQIHGLFWVPMPCAPGTVFVEEECGCGQIVAPVAPVKSTCQRELYLPFTTDHLDESGKGNYVQNDHVVVIDGVARFNGVDSRLIVPRFTNLQRSTTVIIRVKYTSDHVTSPAEHAIVSNSDCENVPSILISEDAFNTNYGVGTLNGNFTLVQVPQTEMPINETMSDKELMYTFDSGVLTGSNGVLSNSLPAPGFLKNVQCGLHIGDADELMSFKGDIDELEVFLCNPY